jgi:3'-5' exonuclease
MKRDTDLKEYLCFDIETCRRTEFFHDLEQHEKDYWVTKHSSQLKEQVPLIYIGDKTAREVIQQHWEENGSFYAEWAQILCVSFSGIEENGETKIVSYSQSEDSEAKMLQKTAALLDKVQPDRFLTGWNINNFDIPFLAKRMMKHGIKLPKYFMFNDTKPWEAKIIDMAKTWEFGKYGATTKFDMACHFLGIESPKSDISGADVARLYFQEQASKDVLERITRYCEQDVRASIDFLKIIHPLTS